MLKFPIVNATTVALFGGTKQLTINRKTTTIHNAFSDLKNCLNEIWEIRSSEKTSKAIIPPTINVNSHVEYETKTAIINAIRQMILFRGSIL